MSDISDQMSASAAATDASLSPLKRARGRPKKTENADDRTSVNTDVSDSGEPKRGRGRPPQFTPKVEDDLDDDSVRSELGSGSRENDEDDDSFRADESQYTPTNNRSADEMGEGEQKRSRGRPRKSPKPDSDASYEPDFKEKRGRGRPPGAKNRSSSARGSREKRDDDEKMPSPVRTKTGRVTKMFDRDEKYYESQARSILKRPGAGNFGGSGRPKGRGRPALSDMIHRKAERPRLTPLSKSRNSDKHSDSDNGELASLRALVESLHDRVEDLHNEVDLLREKVNKR